VKREIIRVEPLSTYLENWKPPTSAVTRCGDTIYGSGFPPFDPALHHGSRHARGSIADPVATRDGRKRSAMEGAGQRSDTMATVGANALLTLANEADPTSGGRHDAHNQRTALRFYREPL
jgi:hypothetical protein